MLNLDWLPYNSVWKLMKVVVPIVDQTVRILIGKVNQLLQRVAKVLEVMMIILQVQSISTRSMSDFWFLWQVFHLWSFRKFFSLDSVSLTLSALVSASLVLLYTSSLLSVLIRIYLQYVFVLTFSFAVALLQASIYRLPKCDALLTLLSLSAPLYIEMIEAHIEGCS